MRWIALIFGLSLIVAAVPGCKQPLFMTECDYLHYRNMVGLPPDLDSNPAAANGPGQLSVIPKPMTVLDPDLPARYISLQECIAIALEQGTDAVNAFGGQIQDRPPLVTGNLQPAPITDAVRVLALNPAIAAAEIENAMSKFDARWTTNMTWSFT